MNQTDAADFQLVIRGLAATFRTDATDPLLYGYWVGLQDLDLAVVKGAAMKAMRHSRFMPTVAELRELTGLLSPEQRAALVWPEVMKAVRRYGYYNSVDFADKAVNATIRNMGGWMRFEERFEEDGEKWVRKDFERIYQAVCFGGMSPEAASPLIGFHDTQNAFHGHPEHISEPVRIGMDLPWLQGPASRTAIEQATQPTEGRVLTQPQH